MREIYFRGKQKDNGEWIYGSLVHQTDWYGRKVNRYFILEGINTNDYDVDEPIDVIESTVGQYILIVDKNGKRVFEGDILKWDEKEWGKPFSEIVRWDYALFNMRQHDWHEFCEIIGNIYDNPELLEGGDMIA